MTFFKLPKKGAVISYASLMSCILPVSSVYYSPVNLEPTYKKQFFLVMPYHARLFIHSCIHSIIRSLIHPSIQSFIHLHIHPAIQLFQDRLFIIAEHPWVSKLHYWHFPVNTKHNHSLSLI